MLYFLNSRNHKDSGILWVCVGGSPHLYDVKGGRKRKVRAFNLICWRMGWLGGKSPPSDPKGSKRPGLLTLWHLPPRSPDFLCCSHTDLIFTKFFPASGLCTCSSLCLECFLSFLLLPAHPEAHSQISLPPRSLPWSLNRSDPQLWFSKFCVPLLNCLCSHCNFTPT